jgi:hypothetical protein
MKEIFVIYNKNTGFIDGGIGKIDRDWDLVNSDGSTMLERIPEILAKDPDRRVAYLPYQMLPNNTEYKIDRGNLVQLTEVEKIIVNQTEADEDKIQAEIATTIRATAIQNLKDRAELPTDYKDKKTK